MRRGHVFRRCSRCGRTWPFDDVGRVARRCGGCQWERFSWAYSVDIGPVGGPRDQRLKTGFATKREAQEAMNALQAELRTASHVAPSKVTVEEYLTEWLRTVKRRLAPGAYDTAAIHVRTYIVPRIGDVRLQALTRRRIRELYGELALNGRVRGGGGLSEKSIHNVHCTLSGALKAAVEDALLAVNPAAAAHKRPESPEQETWNAEQLAEFLTFVEGDRLFALWRLVAMTGLRRGELVGLRRKDLDLDHNRLFVVQQRAKGGGTVNTDRPKGKRGRSIALDQETVQALRDHLKRQERERRLLGVVYDDHGLMFAHEDGKPLHPDSVTKRFGRLVRWSGLPVIKLHGLRHTHGTLLLQAGIHPKVVQERLGHSSIVITYDTYTHSVPSLQDDAAERAAGLLKPAQTSDEEHDTKGEKEKQEGEDT